MLYSNGIEITQFDVPDVRYSDHRPLICDFHVRQARAETEGSDMQAAADPPVRWSIGAVEWMQEGVAWLTLDKANASANSLSRDVMEEFGSLLARHRGSPPRALIITSAKHGFIAGADIKEFVGVQTPDDGVSDDPRGSVAPRSPCRSEVRHRRGDQRLCSRRRAGSCAGVPLSRSSPTTRASRSAFRKCNSAFTRVLAALCAQCSWRARSRPWI